MTTPKKETGVDILAGMDSRVAEYRQAHAALPAKIRALQKENAELKKAFDTALRVIDVCQAAMAAPSSSLLIRDKDGRATHSVTETH